MVGLGRLLVCIIYLFSCLPVLCPPIHPHIYLRETDDVVKPQYRTTEGLGGILYTLSLFFIFQLKKGFFSLTLKIAASTIIFHDNVAIREVI